MSVGNEQITYLRALDLNKKVVNGTYSVRTGRVTDTFVIDNPVEVDGSVGTFTLTVSDGYKIGQTLLISCQTAGNNVTVTVTHHLNGDAGTATMDTVDQYLYMIWTGTEWATLSYGGNDIT